MDSDDSPTKTRSSITSDDRSLYLKPDQPPPPPPPYVKQSMLNNPENNNLNNIMLDSQESNISQSATVYEPLCKLNHLLTREATSKSTSHFNPGAESNIHLNQSEDGSNTMIIRKETPGHAQVVQGNDVVSTKANAESSSNFDERFQTLENLLKLRPTMLGSHSLNCEILIDILNAIYYECQSSGLTRNKNQQKFLELIEPLVQQINQLRLQSKDFDLIKVIGFGNFGQVSVVKSKQDGSVYAMKTLNKIEMLRRAETACYREERDILLHGRSHDWFTKLHYAFQDEVNLYLIMEYYIGGDLLTLFSKYDDFLPEDMSRFYSAQIVMAISFLHNMGYIHRDIKPDNILLDREGHARLADFGSCLKVSSIASDGICTIAVGTPDYISPDVLKAMEGNKRSGQLYDYNIDWWSLGVVIFESLFGETPFYAESLAETYSKIMNHEVSFKFPEEPDISDDAKDLISNLICNKSKRFRSLEQFKSHKWFQGLDWNNLRHVEPPYKPVVSGPDDTSNFDIDDTRPSNPNDTKNNPLALRSKDSVLNIHLPFVGFTATFTATKFEPNSQANGSDKLREDVPDASTGAGAIIQGSKDPDTNLKTVQYTEEGLSIDVQQLESDLNMARQQWIELSTLVNDVRKEKSSLSSQLRAKETEIEEQLEKMSELRKTLANQEKLKRQLADDSARLSRELDRERNSNYSHQMEISNLESKLQTLQSEMTLIKSKGQFAEESSSIYPKGSAKDELIVQQKDYISHLEEQLLKLQQQQPNWDKQVTTAKNLTQDNIYINSYQVDNHKLEHSSSTTWQERRSAKAERHEFKELQLSLQNELEDKRRIQNDLEDKKRELCQALSDLQELKSEIISMRNEQKHKGLTTAAISASTRPLPIVSQSMLFNPQMANHKQDFAGQLKRDQSSTSTSMNAYQLPSNISTHSTYQAEFSSSTEEGYSEADSAYRQIKQQRHQHPTQIPLQSPTQFGSLRNQMRSTLESTGMKLYANQSALDNEDTEKLHRSIDGVPTSQNRHMFVVRTFIMPLKCNVCTSLMTGLIRQGLVCESCGFACHVTCAKSLATIACPFDDKKYIGLDPQRGIGTAYSGYVRIPRPGGVRKGWMRIYVVVCDFKLFLYDLSGELSGSNSSAVSLVGGSSGRDDSVSSRGNSGVSVSRIIDLRDEKFSVTSVLENDVIHASRTDISCIFRLSSTMIGDENSLHTQNSTFYQLMLVDKESEKIKWIEALQELHRIVKRNNLPARNVLSAYSVMTPTQLNILRNFNSVHCCALVEEGPKLLLGTDESLVCCYLDLKAYHRLPKGKRVLKLDVIESEQLIVVMSGRQRHIKLIPMRALESDTVAWIKMPETKSATTFVTQKNLPGSFISVAVKKSLYVYEITRRQYRYAPWREIQSNATIQTLNAAGSLISVGTCSNFHVHNILSRDGPPLYLISTDCADLVYIIQNPFEPLGCYQVTNDCWLLVFENHGVYVDSFGFKTGDADLRFVTKCNDIASLVLETGSNSRLLLLAFSANHIDVYDTQNGEWLQTINLKNTKPLQSSGVNSLLCITCALDLPLLVQITRKGNSEPRLVLAKIDQNIPLAPKSNLAQKINRNSSESFDLSRKLSRVYISEPSDFQHLSHLGPATQPCLIDLNDAASVAAVGASRDNSVDEVRSNPGSLE